MTLFASLHGFNPVRLYQRWRLRGTRLRGVLARRHVDVGQYLEGITYAEFERHLARCRGCEQAQACDRTVVSLGAATSKYTFCPNAKMIARFADTRGIRPRVRALL